MAGKRFLNPVSRFPMWESVFRFSGAGSQVGKAFSKFQEPIPDAGRRFPIPGGRFPMRDAFFLFSPQRTRSSTEFFSFRVILNEVKDLITSTLCLQILRVAQNDTTRGANTIIKENKRTLCLCVSAFNL